MYPEHKKVNPQGNRNSIGRCGMKISILVLLFGMLLTAIAVNAEAAGDAAAGKAIASKQCAMCHGSDGAGSNTAPALKGMAGDRLTSELQAFKSGARKNMMMEMIAKKLSDKDIADLAAYFSAL